MLSDNLHRAVRAIQQIPASARLNSTELRQLSALTEEAVVCLSDEAEEQHIISQASECLSRETIMGLVHPKFTALGGLINLSCSIPDVQETRIEEALAEAEIAISLLRSQLNTTRADAFRRFKIQELKQSLGGDHGKY